MVIFPAPSNTAAGESQVWPRRAAELRSQMRAILHLPRDKCDLAPTVQRRFEGDGYRIESVTYAAQPGLRVTALLYRPEKLNGPVPAIVVACGHGGSKSGIYAQYAGQLYAKLGFVCFVPDTIGEEERDDQRRMGARGHDRPSLHGTDSAKVQAETGRLIMGKIIWDLMRGIDYLHTRPEVRQGQIGIVGYSLGGATAGATAILDDRVRAAVICGWVFRARVGENSKACTRTPYAEFTKRMGYDEMTALLAPHCSTLFMLGEKDGVIDADQGGAAAVRDLQDDLRGARRILDAIHDSTPLEAAIEPNADHRPYFLSARGAVWLQEHLMKPDERKSIPPARIRLGDWADRFHARIDKLYDTPQRERGLEAVDIGAIYRDPKDLACFPGDSSPPPECTMTGWLKSILK